MCVCVLFLSAFFDKQKLFALPLLGLYSIPPTQQKRESNNSFHFVFMFKVGIGVGAVSCIGILPSIVCTLSPTTLPFFS